MSKFPFYKQLDGMGTAVPLLSENDSQILWQNILRATTPRTTSHTAYRVNLLGISEAAASIGLRATGIRTSMDKLRNNNPNCLHHPLESEHFVVLYK